jgi:membrane-bound ClpP family serine protease
MRRVALSSVVLAALLLVFAGAPVSGAQPNPGQPNPGEPTPVVVLRVEGPIDRSTLAYLDDRLSQAERDGAVVVLQLDTSGTLGEDGVALAQRVADLDVPVLAWVGPTPATASGAGLLLMYASSLAGSSRSTCCTPRSCPPASRPRSRGGSTLAARTRCSSAPASRCRPPTRSISASPRWRPRR